MHVSLKLPSTIMPPPTCEEKLAKPLSQRAGKH